MSKKIFFLFCCLTFYCTLSAQYRTNVHSISRREGLSNGAVNAIARDAEGYVWFGTWNGLNRYDGSSIATYLPGNKAFAIHNQVVRELYPTAKGPVWMLTNKGVALYDNTYDRFYPFFTNEPEQINYENDISMCHSDEFGTKVAVFGRGIFSFDSIARQFVKIEFEAASLQASLGMKRLHSIGSEFLRISGNQLQKLIHLPINAAISSSLGVLINNRPFLLLTQRGGNAVMVDIDKKAVSPLRITDDIITSFAPSANPGRLWAGTEKGKIYSLNTDSGEFEILNISTDLFVKNPIATRVLSICETAPDILWIGTDGNGVYNMKLSDFPNKSLSSRQLSYPIVRCILVTRNKDILVGTKGGGIDVFDSKGNHIKEISVKDGLSNNSVLSFHELTDGTIWVGTDGIGIDIISPDFKRIKNFPRDFITNNELAFASVYRILEDNDQRLYLGTSGFGVIMVEFDKNKHPNPVYYEQLILDKNAGASGQQKQIVYALTQERPGIIWIGTRGFGVYQYNTITKRVVSQFNSHTHPDLIKNDDILALYTDRQNSIWVGSSSGIYFLSPEVNDSVKINGLKLQQELSNTSIHAIQMDQQGNLWASTNQGLSCIDVRTQTVKSFTSNDGLINVEYSDGASFFDNSTGQLYVGGTMGVDMIQTREIKFTSFFPPLAINDLYIRNQPVEITEGSVLHNRMNLQPGLVLKSNQNALTFFVSPLVFWGKERHRISYRLKNFDDNWTVSLQNQAISFTNLNPDKYFLQLRVSDENGNWSDQIKEVEIIINPPFWRTKWAIAGYILFFIGIQLLIIQSYIRRESRKKEAALTEYKQQNEKELQNYKIEFFTNVAHEFRTPLTLITSHIHALLEEAEATGKNPRLLKVYNNSVKLQKLVLEIIQFRKLEKGKEPLNISKVNPELLALEVISDLELLAEKREITCEVICYEKDIYVNTDADKYQRIITNLVSNAIKYNNPGGWVKVRITFCENEFITEVEDNGIGINPEFKNKVFEPFGISSAQKRGSFPDYKSTGLGLAVTKGIIELLQGTITFESNPNEGTLFICRIPSVDKVNTTSLIEKPVVDSDEMVFIDEPKTEGTHATSDISPGKPIVLVVDDDQEILALLNELLSPLYNLCFAKNGKEALLIIEKQRIDLVVSDVMMPEMDGVELCRKIRENFDTSHLPLILLTAKEEIEDRIKGLQAGADSYIPKPFHPDHLKIRIEKLLTMRQNIRKRFASQDESTPLINEIPDPFFQKLLDYIDENIDDETLSSEKLCERLAISKSSLYNKTKSVLGTTPHGLINQRKVRKASILLDSTTLSVSEIIDQTGFNSRAHFYELFNKAFGCSPSEYRQKKKTEV
jgi:signal transduction histidine kinase/ligand-binding sensor domain-containing protein/CheY-like chemotaxis protein/AraC-like DNA-binding protein